MSLPWYPFFWGNYGSKTMHLTQGQHGSYILFLHWIYTTGTPVPHKQRFSIARATLDLERSDAIVVLEGFFERRGANWHSAKAEEIIQDGAEKHRRYVEAGKLGGLKKSSIAKASLEPGSTNHNHKDRIVDLSSFVVGKKEGNGHSPENRLALFQIWLQKQLGPHGAVILAEAADPTKPGYSEAVAHCKRIARDHGKGWPHQWPA